MIPDKYFTGEIWRTETWEDFIERYGKDFFINCRKYDVDKLHEYKEDYALVCEKNISNTFRRKHSYYYGQPFTIIERYDYLTTTPAWIIQFENGTKEIALPDDMSIQPKYY